MNWDTLIRQFSNYLKLERSLSENSIQAYVRDVAKLRQFIDNSNKELSPVTVTPAVIQEFVQTLGVPTYFTVHAQADGGPNTPASAALQEGEIARHMGAERGCA